MSESAAMALPVSLKGVADAPIAVAHDVTGYEDTVIRLNLSAALKDDDSSETLSVVVGAVVSAGPDPPPPHAASVRAPALKVAAMKERRPNRFCNFVLIVISISDGARALAQAEFLKPTWSAKAALVVWGTPSIGGCETHL